jgi:hypothetical protein
LKGKKVKHIKSKEYESNDIFKENGESGFTLLPFYPFTDDDLLSGHA